MDLSRHLRHFLAVAEEMHFGRAAELLGIAQPPLSQSVQRLERELGATLFDRSRRRVELTTAGRLLVDEARALLAREERLRTVVRKAEAGELGELRAGVPPDTPATALRALLDGLAAEAPGLRVDLHELTTGEQVRALAAAQLDVGLVHHPVDAPDLEFGPEAAAPLGVLLPRTAPLARLGEVALADLAGHDLVLFPRATAPGWYERVLDVCRGAGFTPDRVRHAGNPEFLVGLVLAGHGVAFAPEAAARREPRVAWRPLAGRPLVRRLSAAWPRAGTHPAARRFADLAAGVLAPDGPLPGPAAPAGRRPWSVVYTPPDHP
ncbi:LysR family transcriptional regulator [Nocardiopsis trehalosi]|jgi:DNA-binding transcriptional LysR family regulator|uniref:LysR family transcriptional regulator n=1 Tax=Nocardiopsis trehalosi TaxID=109329 RepID=UPI00082D07E1|nr:LysR family transcriptional regulator [Nocardiopsis trehalosi]